MDVISNFPLKTQDCLAPGFGDPGSFLGSLRDRQLKLLFDFEFREI